MIARVRAQRFITGHLLPCSVSFFLLCVALAAVSEFRLSVVYAQVEPPDRKFLFAEDREKRRQAQVKRQTRDQRFKGTSAETLKNMPFDIDSPKLQFESEKNIVRADGGIRVSAGSATIEADSGSVDLNSKQGHLVGDVWFSDPATSFTAEEADLNLETKLGTMKNSRVEVTDGSYVLEGEKIQKISDDEFQVENGSLTTCECEDGTDSAPWRIAGRRTNIEKEGYGQVWDALFRVHDVPVFYCPYVIFPVKTERQSGLLPATIGSGNEGGFHLELPFFWAIDESTDATISPILDTSTRYGVRTEFRHYFSQDHRLQAGFTFLNEDWRNGDLQGTDIEGLSDPTIDENRKAAYWNERWRSSDSNNPMQVLIDGRYVSDDLLLREFDIEEIGPFNARYVTSRAVARTTLWETYTAEMTGEFNQALITSDDYVFQRLPEMSLEGIHRFRPFGSNPYGLKVIYQNNLSAVDFVRRSYFDQRVQEGVHPYDGWRLQADEQFKVPFYYGNFFDLESTFRFRATQYEMNDQDLIDNSGNLTLDEDNMLAELPGSSDRVVPEASFRLRSTVERVFDLDDDSILKRVAELGTLGRESSLVRLKHTMTPELRYRAIAAVDQDDNPLFDSEDRLSQRSVVTYGLTQRLYGRYENRDHSIAGIEEVAPEASEIGSLQDTGVLDLGDDYGFNPIADLDDAGFTKRGDIRELANLKLLQSWDILENNRNRDPERSAFSDLSAELTLLPNEYVRLRGRTDFNVDEQNFSAYTLDAQLLDKRGDQLRTRLTFNNEVVRQLESSLEFVVTDRLKVGYYTRYDDLEGQFIENRAGLRIASSCNRCWTVDVGVTDKINPNETKFLVSATLAGFGDFGNTFLTRNRPRTTRSGS